MRFSGTTVPSLEPGAAWGGRLCDRGRQVEPLPMGERCEQWRRAAQRHQRVERWKSSRRRRLRDAGDAHARHHRPRHEGARHAAAGHHRRIADDHRRSGSRGHAASRYLHARVRQVREARQDLRRRHFVGFRRAAARRRHGLFREDQRRRCARLGQALRNDDVARHVRQRVVQHLGEGGEQVLVVVWPVLAASAQRSLDFRQHAAIGQEPVERDVELVDLRREIGQHAFHERAPYARIGIHGARGGAYGVEDVGDGERIVDLALGRIAEQLIDAQVERGELAMREAVEKARGVLERGLAIVVERGQHAQRGERCIGIHAPPFAAHAFDPALEEIAQRLVEALDPFAALAAKRLDLAVGDVAVGLEEIVGLLDRNPHQVEELQAILGEARAQHRAAFVRSPGSDAFEARRFGCVA